MSHTENTPLLEVRNLKKYFGKKDRVLHAVDDISVTIQQGKTLGVVGESGCGKSTLGRTVLRLLEPTDGQIIFDGQDITHVSEREMRKYRQSMQIIFQDPYLYADDTTLGADNAVGLVNMLALMEDDTVVHPPMELLFTVCEEDGMEGIRQLDMSTIRSRRMLNMDCGDPDVMCVSCAGFVHYVMRLPVTAAGAAGQAYTLQIDGLAGGHSGLMIGTGRASAVVLMGRVLCELLRKAPCRIVSVDCERTMGIAPHMQAEIVLKPEQEPDARKVLEDLLAALREEYANTDPELSLTLEPLGHEADQAMDEASGRRCAELMYLLPYGVMKYDSCDRDVILNSVNTVRVTCENGVVEYEQMIRSPIDAYKWELVDRLRILAELTGASLVVQDSYAGWPFRKDSPLQQLCCQVYNRLTGQELKIEKLNS